VENWWQTAGTVGHTGLMLFSIVYGCYGFKTETENRSFKVKPNRGFLAAMWRFFSDLKNGPARSQTSPNNSLIIASTVWSDRLTAQSGVARQPNYSPWQVDLCAAVGAVRTDVVHTGGLPAMQTNIGLSWCGSLITLLCLQLMVCFTHISCKNWNREKTETTVFCEKPTKPNRKWNSRTVTLCMCTVMRSLLLLPFV